MAENPSWKEYSGVNVEYNDRFIKPEQLTFALTEEPVSTEFAATVRKLEAGEKISVEEYNNLPEVKYARQRVGDGIKTGKIQTPERHALRARLARELRQTSGSAIKQVNPKTGKLETAYRGMVKREHRVDIILGLPSSGKSSALVDPISAKYQSRLIDSDEAKKLIPEFDDGWGAGRVHGESKEIINRVMEKSIMRGENMVIPKVGGDYESIRELILKLKSVGYKVHIHLNELDMNKAAGRNLRRFATDGRFVDLVDTSFKYENKPTEVFERIVEECKIDGYTRVSNDVKIGDHPVQLGGTEKIEFDWVGNGFQKESINRQSNSLETKSNIEPKTKEARWEAVLQNRQLVVVESKEQQQELAEALEIKGVKWKGDQMPKLPTPFAIAIGSKTNTAIPFPLNKNTPEILRNKVKDNAVSSQDFINQVKPKEKEIVSMAINATQKPEMFVALQECAVQANTTVEKIVSLAVDNCKEKFKDVIAVSPKEIEETVESTIRDIEKIADYSNA